MTPKQKTRYRVRARDALIAGGVITFVSLVLGAALQGESDQAPAGPSIGLLVGIALMLSALFLRRPTTATSRTASLKAAAPGLGTGSAPPRAPQAHPDEEMRLAWEKTRGGGLTARWPEFIAWATRNMAGDVEIWIIRRDIRRAPATMPSTGQALPQSRRVVPIPELSRDVVATCRPDDTVIAAEAMVEARGRAAQAELDAHAQFLMSVAASNAEQREIRDQAVRDRAELRAQQDRDAIAARDAHLRAREADALADVLNQTNPRG
jgi:hypothetical protein